MSVPKLYIGLTLPQAEALLIMAKDGIADDIGARWPRDRTYHAAARAIERLEISIRRCRPGSGGGR